MSVKYEKELGSWEFSCIFGCHGYEFENETDAIEAFLTHHCPEGSAA